MHPDPRKTEAPTNPLAPKPVSLLIKLFKNYFLTIFGTIVFALLVRLYVVEAFRVPTDFMAPTLVAGDHIFAHKMFKTIRRGDVIIFNFPNDPRKDFIKRVIGVGGDTVEIREGVLILNGKEVSIAAPRDGETEVFSEEVGKHRYQVFWNSADSKKMIEVKVPDGHVFVLGDHRDRKSVV